MKSDIQIAQAAEMKPIIEIAESIGLSEDDIEVYGKYKAKISMDTWGKLKDKHEGKLILVTAINPTPAGEGKTTTTIGLGQALNKIGKKAIIALREPSLGPSFGVKGGAAGGGYSQIVPMEDINLHFTGDIHAVSAANNLLVAMLDNSIQQGNPLNIDPRQIVLRRAMDLNDRALRNIIVGLGGKAHGVPRETGFDISVATEVMAILCLASDLKDLKERLRRIIVAYTYDGKAVTAEDLKAVGSMALLLKDAIKPNLVQTIENTPALVHGGPFANMAHGCNSIVATKFGLKLADYLVTEAGFGADLGAEKFFNLKCRYANLKPDVTVIVASIRSLKNHGGVAKDDLNKENIQALEKGFANLEKHLENISKFGVPVVVALNEFPSDSQAEFDFVLEKCADLGVEISLSRVWADGGKGGEDLAEKVIAAAEKGSNFKYLYELELSLKNKIEIIAKEIYGAQAVNYSKEAEISLKKYEDQGYGKLPICMAKTQYSFSDDQNLKGRPEGFTIDIKEVRLSAGAGFVIPMAGTIMTMPGLNKVPSAENIDILDNGEIVGLF